MARVLHIFAHPGQSTSRVNTALWTAAQGVEGVTRLDLYARYPRYQIRIAEEQDRLAEHDIILLQFPLFWYSCPGLVKEWIDLTLQHGWAYGTGGDALKGKYLMLALSAGGPQEAYSPTGYQHFDLRTFLTPFEQTATLCQMTFLPPYVLYGALKEAPDNHAKGFVELLEALRDDRFDLASATGNQNVLTHDTLPITPALPGAPS